MKCPICGAPMIHYRLRGYQCFSEVHNEMARELDARIVAMVSSGKISQVDFDTYLEGKLPESIRDIRNQYGIKDFLEDIQPEDRYKTLHQNEWMPPEDDGS